MKRTNEAQPALLGSLWEHLFRSRPGEDIWLKEDAVPTLFPAVEAMLMPSIRRIQELLIYHYKKTKRVAEYLFIDLDTLSKF